MFNRVNIIFILIAILFVSGYSQSLYEILDKHYQARGGIKNIKAVKTIQYIGKMSIIDKEFTISIFKKRPGKFRSEIDMEGKTIIQVCDGKIAWQINPLTGSANPVDFTGDELVRFLENADIDGFLIDWKQKGYRLDFIGKENVEGKQAYRIKVVRKDSSQSYIFLDSKSFLEIQKIEKIKVNGKEFDVVTSFDDFKKVGKLTIPFYQKTRGPMYQKIRFDRVVFNEQISDSLFIKPMSK